MAKMEFRKWLCILASLLLLSCECPFQEERERISSKNNGFYAELLIGTWQCYYPMIIGGLEFKQIKFMSGGKADIIMAQQRDTEWFTETYDYAYYGNTLRFTKGRTSFSLNVEGYLFPELYLQDSFGHYTMAKRRVN